MTNQLSQSKAEKQWSRSGMNLLGMLSTRFVLEHGEGENEKAGHC